MKAILSFALACLIACSTLPSVARSADTSEWVCTVLGKVRSKWVKNDKRVMAWFTLSPSGKLNALRIHIPSLDGIANASAENAIRDAAPFKAAPDGREHSFTLGFYDGECGGCEMVWWGRGINECPPPSQEEINEYQLKGKPNPASANAQYCDKDGRPLKTEDMPPAVRSFVARNWSPRDGAMALLQVDTGNVNQSEIATTQWSRGYSSCSVGDFEDGIMVYVTKPNTNRIEVRKLGYETISLTLPSFSKGQVVWLGKIELKPYKGKTGTISGSINDVHGKSLKVKGWITFGLNGAQYEKKINVMDGKFTISDVSPGEYLVYFNFPHHSVETWFSEVSGNVEKTLTAYPQKHLTLRDIENGKSQEVKLAPRSSHYEEEVTFSALSFRQSGEEIHLFSPSYRIEIERKGGQREVQYKGSTNWSGKLSAGDRIVLLERNSQKTAQIVEVVAVQ